MNQTLKVSEQRINDLIILRQALKTFAPIVTILESVSTSLLIGLREVTTDQNVQIRI